MRTRNKAKETLCVDKIKTEGSGKARKRPMAEGEGEEESKRKRPDSPAESVTSDSASVADDTEAPEQDLVESLSEQPTDDTMLTVKDEENAAPTSPVSESSQLPVYKMDDCNVVFNVGVPKKEPLEQIVKEEPSLENCSPIQTSLQNTYGEQSPPPFEDDTKIMMQDVKPKVDDNFFSLSLSDRIMEPPGSGPLPKAFDEIPMPGKLSVKREGLFESVQNESVIVPMIQTSVESFVPKEEILDSPPTLQTVDQQTVTTQSQTVTLNNIKPECSEDSVSSEPTRPPSVSAPSLSPLPLTAYAPPSPRQPLSEPQNIDDKSSIIMPSFVPVDEKPTINIPSVPSALSASHHSGFSSFYHPHFHPHPGKINPSPPSYLSSGLQSEPQNLKIKQEVIPPESVQPSSDPLQSLKEVKVPGYSNSSCISQPLLPTSIAPSSTQDLSTTTQSSSPFQSVGPSVDNIKKEPESFHPIRTNTPSKSPSVKPLDTRPTPIVSPASRTSSNHTPPFPPPLPPVSHSAANLIAPSPTVNSVSSLPQSVIHPSQQPSPLSRVSPGHLAHPHPFVPAMHPHHLIHHPLFAAAAAHAAAVHHSPYHPHHPYGGYPYPFPYGPYPIPQPVPPPSHPREPQKIETVMTSHHSSVTTRSLREETREESNSQHTIQEISTHHSSTSSHLSSSVHHHSGEKSISHSTSSSSSASVQHKINSSKRGTSPAATQASSSCHLSATLSQTTSSSLSSSSHQHSHQHHHQTATGERLSPSPHHLGNRPSGNKPHPHHPGLMVHPHHPMLAAPSSSLEALRAHAQAAAMQSPVPLPPSHGSGNMMGHPAFLSPDGTREVEIKPEPLVVSGDEGGGGEEEEVPSPTHPRPPSPEPKIEDSECHRSQSAIFLRHWNRGDYNSCARTDLTFKPVPDSKLARKREERIRKQAEKEREEREKVQARKIATPEKPETSKPPSRGPIESITSPYDRFNPRDMRSGYPDTPALRQLSEYARPHGGFSPVTLQRSAALGLPPQCIDPMLHYQLNSMNSMYGPSARDRYQGLGPGGLHQFSLYPGPGGPSQAAALSQLERERLERLGIPAPGQTGGAPSTAGPPQAPQPATSSLDADRLALTTDPMVRLQMAGISPEYHAHTHAHTHAHSHTHLHLHPGQQAGQNQTPTTPDPGSAFPLPASGSGGYPRPSLLPPREAALALHHPSDLLARPYADQLAHQAAAHEHLQRQILMERERFPHPSLMAHHEEYLRQQRERELKVRALEEAARGSRP